ncbi:MAG TPA: biopolymer transporter ExbD [Polyangium sp.]|nr:biopolymer transporter ExbD [Polyangium sp.]
MSGGKSHGPSKHHNPHAHVIHQPGRRLMHGISLKFVQNKVSGGHKKATNTALNLVSFIDFLITTVIFLLMSFSASGEITVDKNVKLPKAENVEDIIDAPMVAVNGNQILVDGVLAGSTRAVEELGRMQKIDELFTILKNKRELWKQVQPNKPFPGVCILQVDQNVPALVVKSVFQTAAFAGYPNVSFMVGKLPKSG